MHLIILGALPPPRGGVTTHIERLIPYLEEAGIKFVVLDHSRVRKKEGCVVSFRREPIKVLFNLIQPGVKVLHCPLSNITASKIIFFLLMKIMGIRITVTLVASPEQTMGNSSLNLNYMLALARLSTHIVATNRGFQKMLIDNGICENKVSIIPAFVPPINTFIEKQPVPQRIIEFYTKRKPLIITYAYGPDLYEGEDLYGLDLIVRLAQELRTDFPLAGFIVVIPEITNKNYFRKLRLNICETNLEPFFQFAIGDNLSFISFLKYADLFIRATNTDGDALTLREALHYGVPSVASDACCRPEKTILFRSRDISDLHRVVHETLHNSGNRQYDTKNKQINNAELFIDVFKRSANLKN